MKLWCIFVPNFGSSSKKDIYLSTYDNIDEALKLCNKLNKQMGKNFSWVREYEPPKRRATFNELLELLKIKNVEP